jgi:hypothetical protein
VRLVASTKLAFAFFDPADHCLAENPPGLQWETDRDLALPVCEYTCCTRRHDQERPTSEPNLPVCVNKTKPGAGWGSGFLQIPILQIKFRWWLGSK